MSRSEVRPEHFLQRAIDPRWRDSSLPPLHGGDGLQSQLTEQKTLELERNLTSTCPRTLQQRGNLLLYWAWYVLLVLHITISLCLLMYFSNSDLYKWKKGGIKSNMTSFDGAAVCLWCTIPSLTKKKRVKLKTALPVCLKSLNS